MEFEVCAASHLRRKFLTSLMPSMIAQLKLRKHNKVIIVTVEEINTLGATLQLPGIDSFVITLKPQSLMGLGLSLAHEMVHVKQICKGQLKTLKNGKHAWLGKSYPKKTPYLDQPWEIDAFARQEIIFRKSIEE